MTMIYEAEIDQIIMGKLFIEADNLEQAKQVAEQCVQEAQNLVNVDFDEIWGYDVRDVSESDSAGETEVIKAEDIL